MSNAHRSIYSFFGSVCVIPTLGSLFFFFAIALYPCSHDPMEKRAGQIAKVVFTELPFTAIFLLCVVLVYGGVFLCVKSVFGPPRFWANNTYHMLVTAGVASILVFVPFALVVFVFSG